MRWRWYWRRRCRAVFRPPGTRGRPSRSARLPSGRRSHGSCVFLLQSADDLTIAVFDLHDVAVDGGRGRLAQPRIHARAGLLRGHERIDDDLVALDLPCGCNHIAAIRAFERSVLEEFEIGIARFGGGPSADGVDSRILAG